MSAFNAVRTALIAAGIAGFYAAAPAMATPTFYLTTGQTGAQTQIDVNHSSTWTITAPSNYLLGGGDFTMKEGSHADDSLTLSVYLGTSSAGTLVKSLTFTENQFCAAHSSGNCQQFASTQFRFATPYELQQGQTYFIALTSTAPDVQSQAYFIKGVQDSIVSGADGSVPMSNVVAPVPEPASLALLGVGTIALGALRRRPRAA